MTTTQRKSGIQAMLPSRHATPAGGATQLGNHLDSVVLEVHGQHAAPLTYESYLPYGGTSLMAGTSQQEAEPKTHRYTDKERDDSTALNYHGARYYAPWLGRWLNPDPAGPIDCINLYRMVRSNPLLLHDPTGLQPERRDVSEAQLSNLREAQDAIKTVKTHQLPRGSGNQWNDVLGTRGLSSLATYR